MQVGCPYCVVVSAVCEFSEVCDRKSCHTPPLEHTSPDGTAHTTHVRFNNCF